MSKSIRIPTNTATVEVLANIESWKTSIQINYEVTKTMPSQQEIRAAFQRLISRLKETFKFHQDLIVSQMFGTQKVSDDEVPSHFQHKQKNIHSTDTRKPLKFPDKSPPSKTNAINSSDGAAKSKEKGNQRSQSVLLLRMSSRRDLRRRRRKRELGSRQKESRNPNRLLHPNLLRLFLQTLLRQSQGEVTLQFSANH